MSATGATIFGCAGTELGAVERAFFGDADPWGFILFARNLENPAQIRRLTGALRDSVARAAPIFIDQEGGRVARLTPPHWRGWLPPFDQMQRAGAGGVRSMWLRYRIIADELLTLGIDGNSSPMADIAGPDTHPFLKNRCYGDDPGAVSDAAGAVADGLIAGGVLPVLKHIPGHGRAVADSHLDLPHLDVPGTELDAWDFAPFRALAGLPMAMTAHIVYRALDPVAPATLSAAVIGAIRDRIGFQGLLMTDDISMGALIGPLGARSTAALAAGCDAILHCNGKPVEMAEVAAAAGRFTAEAERRAAAALTRRRQPEPIDIPALEAELEALLAAAENG